jgi:transposase
VVKKIQLNDEQWNTLQALREAHAQRRPTHAIRISERLRSNGLVSSDRQGCKFLTEQGLQRLNQGR